MIIKSCSSAEKSFMMKLFTDESLDVFTCAETLLFGF